MTAATWGMYGQQTAVAALRQALASGRLAHAYLLTGPEGVGKATLARRLVQALLCEGRSSPLPLDPSDPLPLELSGPLPLEGEGWGGGASDSGGVSDSSLSPSTGGVGGAPSSKTFDPCLECRACRRVEAGEIPDVERIAVGGVCDENGPAHRDHAADNSTRIRICQVRRLERVASLTPFQAPRRIFIVDTADDLQTEAGHALLKTLEEPPASVLLILLATDVDALLPTVRSRCQEIALRPMPHADLVTALRERPGLDLETAEELARESQGRYGLAVRLHTDPSLRMLRETATAEALRLATASRNERFDYASTLAGRWSRERQSVLDTLDAWRYWWRDRLIEASISDGGAHPSKDTHISMSEASNQPSPNAIAPIASSPLPARGEGPGVRAEVSGLVPEASNANISEASNQPSPNAIAPTASSLLPARGEGPGVRAEVSGLVPEASNANISDAWEQPDSAAIATTASSPLPQGEGLGVRVSEAPPEVNATPAEAVRALQAIQRTREHLLANTNTQLALEVMMLDLPVLAATTGKEAREAAAPSA